MRKIANFVLFIFVSAALAGHFITRQPNPLAANLIYLTALKDLQRDPALLVTIKPGLSGLAGADCKANWMLGIVLERIGDNPGKKEAWENLLDCPDANLDILLAKSTRDEDLVRQIVSRYPDNPAALFSLGYITYPQNPQEAAGLFEQGLKYDPTNGISWCYLGLIRTRAKQYEQAASAYLNCCRNNDPGSNGCYNAGRMMENLGKPGRAIVYYRLSRWQTAINRANELEKQFRP